MSVIVPYGYRCSVCRGVFDTKESALQCAKQPPQEQIYEVDQKFQFEGKVVTIDQHCVQHYTHRHLYILEARKEDNNGRKRTFQGWISQDILKEGAKEIG